MAKHSPPAPGPSLPRQHSSGNCCSHCHQCWCSPAWAPAPHTPFFCAHFNSVSRCLIYTFTSPVLTKMHLFLSVTKIWAVREKEIHFFFLWSPYLFSFFFSLSVLFSYFRRLLRESAIQLIKQSPRAHLEAPGLPNLQAPRWASSATAPGEL